MSENVVYLEQFVTLAQIERRIAELEAMLRELDEFLFVSKAMREHYDGKDQD